MSDRPVLAACFNRPYVPHTATMLRSFSASAAGPVRWYLIGDGSVDDGLLDKLVGFARECGLDAEPFRIPDGLVAAFDDCGRYPPIAWYRTVLPEALKHEDRVIYLDSDVIVLHDLRPLWEVQLGEGHLFAAVGTPSYAARDSDCERLRLPPRSLLLNSGVMVMDLARMRAARFSDRIRDFVLAPDGPELRNADQDSMNSLFPGSWTPLDPSWNCLTSIVLPFVAGGSWEEDLHHGAFVLERAARSPSIVHFEGASVVRPWHVRCFNPFAPLYRSYRAATPWPLEQLEARGHDRLFARIPPRLQARLWLLRHHRSLLFR